MKAKTESRKPILSLQFLFGELYGQAGYQKAKWYHDAKTYASLLHRLVDTIMLTIDMNMARTDGYHRMQLLKECENAHKALKGLKTVDHLSESFLVFQTRLFFTLIGLMPKRLLSKSVRNIESNWQLDDYRTILWTQTNVQKLRLILSLCQREYVDRVLPIQELLKIKRTQCNDDPDKFLSWFKKQYPDIYLDIF